MTTPMTERWGPFDWAVAPVVAVASVLVWVSGVRGVDHPAQVFRVELFERYGLTAWNSQWYAGHHTPGYGIVYPALGSWFGAAAVGIVATVLSVVVFAALVRSFTTAQASARRGAVAAFSVLALVNLWEGRLPFAVGTAISLAALYLLLRRRWVGAFALAGLAAFASPLSGAFIALVGGAWVLGDLDRKRPLQSLTHPAGWWAVAAVLPVVALAWLYPQGGSMPFIWQHLALTLVTATVALVLLPPQQRVARAVTAVSIVAALLFFFVPTPVGQNLVRFATIAGPAVIVLIKSRWGWVLGALIVGWHASPLVDLPAALDAPAQEAAFHQPLIDEINARTDGPVRIEIPFTHRHWEAAWVAPDVALARGWERQLDYRFNGDIIDPDLETATYTRWLHDTAVAYVAIPDVRLETESEREAEVARASAALELVWSNADWELYEVRDPTPLAAEGIEVTTIQPDRIDLLVAWPGGPYEIRVHYSPAMRLEPEGCVRESPDGWTLIDDVPFGRASIVAAGVFDRAFGSGCE